jgi:hypothetical protein
MNRDDNTIGVGRWKLAQDNLLATSDGRNWSGIAAEKRRHSAGELPEMIADRTVIGFALKGNAEAVIHRRGSGVRQATRAATGTFWLCPGGVAEDQIRISAAIPEMLHIYLPRQPFLALARDDDFPNIDAATVNYDVGAHDPWIAEVGRLTAQELAHETSSGRLLVETAVETWLSQGIAPQEIGLFVRTPQLVPRARAAIAGIAGAAEMTAAPMHLAKGLEFRAVVVMACDEGVLPLDERVADAADEAELDDIYETERRLLYVACTRAREHLLLTGVLPTSEYLADFSADLG